jgi:dihydroorotate dehydrogenase electron transfer subunit
MPEDRLLRVESIETLGTSYHRLSLILESDPPPWDPGQFLMISVGGRLDPLLRRPYSIYGLYDPAEPRRPLQILFKVQGRGSALLAEARPGDRLSCLFPLGRGFAPDLSGDRNLLLVAGGAGIASLHSLAAAEIRAGRSPHLLFGARNAEETKAAGPTRALGLEARLSTDDGSAGRRGLVTDLLDSFLSESGRGRFVVCACGPMPMMKATAAVAERHGVPCYLSLESTMACGFGVCVGCVVGVRRTAKEGLRYERTCIEGPVMNAAEIVW